MKKSINQKDLNAQQDKKLYIGTNEQTAKLSPAKGLIAPIFLTDVYPGFFCKETCKNNERWGIISVSLDKLRLDMFAPSLAFKKTKTWEKSLTEHGVCVYLSQIPPNAIQKVMIYNPSGKHTNIVINQLVNESPNPTSLTSSVHKINYTKSLGISRWLNGEEIKCVDIFNGDNNVKLIEYEDELANRFGLDVYYIKPEEKGRKHAHK